MQPQHATWQSIISYLSLLKVSQSMKSNNRLIVWSNSETVKESSITWWLKQTNKHGDTSWYDRGLFYCFTVWSSGQMSIWFHRLGDLKYLCFKSYRYLVLTYVHILNFIMLVFNLKSLKGIDKIWPNDSKDLGCIEKWKACNEISPYPCIIELSKVLK